MAWEEGNFVSPGCPRHPHTWELGYSLCRGSQSKYPACPRECFLLLLLLLLSRFSRV